MGREGEGKKDFLDRVELHKELCSEKKCYINPYKFENDNARYLYFRGDLTSLFYKPYEEFKCNFVMLSGLPGVGKDYCLKQSNSKNIVSLDDIRKE